MPRNRIPSQIAFVTGADRLHPSRYANRHEPAVAPIGEPPEGLSDAEREAWLDLVADMPWLARSDRMMVDLTVRLMMIVAQPQPPVSAIAQLRLCLSSLGATPVDRSKVQAPQELEDDPASEFLA